MRNITVENPTRTRKWGWGWNAGVTDNEKGQWQVLPPAKPDYEGTWATILRKIEEDRNFQAVRSGGTYFATQWFYDGQPIVNKRAVLNRMDEIRYQREWNHQPGYTCPVLVQLED